MKGLILGFALGFGMGVAGTYLFMVGKRAEELEEMDEEPKQSSKKAAKETPVTLTKSESANSTKVDYTKFFANNEVVEQFENRLSEEEAKKEEEHNDIPEIIPPDEYGLIDDYDAMTFTYFRDGVLVDDGGDPLSTEDAAMLLGDDALNHFGEYEDNTVYVRNDVHEAYYEIVRIERDYSEYAKSKPRPVEIE